MQGMQLPFLFTISSLYERILSKIHSTLSHSHFQTNDHYYQIFFVSASIDLSLDSTSKGISLQATDLYCNMLLFF